MVEFLSKSKVGKVAWQAIDWLVEKFTKIKVCNVGWEAINFAPTMTAATVRPIHNFATTASYRDR